MARQTSGVAARFEFLVFCAGRKMFKAMPLQRAVKVGAALGSLAAATDRVNRPVAMRNLEIAFPDWNVSQRKATLAAMYRNWGRCAAEWCHIDELTTDNVYRFVHYDGVEHWKRALEISNGRGGFILIAHFGNFELMGVAHALYGNPIAAVHRPLRNRLIDEAIRQVRTACGNQLIARKGAAKEMAAILRCSGVIAVLIDLDVRRGVFVDFFSLKACTSDSLARLAMAAEVPVVPAFPVREGNGLRHRAVILPPIDLVTDGNRDEAIVENTQRMTRVVEDMVRQYPDHWNWIHRRWKTRPPGEPRFY